MSNVKWSGIEQKKYGLTARWYVSAKYGYATDEGGWGLYNPVSNVDGWGGKKRPFNGLDLAISRVGIVVVDSGQYRPVEVKSNQIVGDGDVKILGMVDLNGSMYYDIHFIQCTFAQTGKFKNCTIAFSQGLGRRELENCVVMESIYSDSASSPAKINSVFISVGGLLPIAASGQLNANLVIINCPNLMLYIPSTRPANSLIDYSIVVGTVRTNIPINGKTTGVTIEDFKAEGQYFRKSYSEVDLFGNASGSGASVAQLNTIFNNFYYPYIDDWQYLDLSLRPDVDDRVRYGGLNGHFIGAFPVGYHFDIPTLWNTYRDVVNTTNVELNMMDRLIRTNPAIPGVYTSTTITLPNAIDETDVAMFFKNNVYDSNGVAVQRLDYSVDPAKDAALEQRTVYSYRMKTSPDDVTPLTDWKEYELDRAPTVDASGNSNIDDLFDSETETKQPIKRFIIEITLRSE